MFPAYANHSWPSPNAWSLSRPVRLAQPDLTLYLCQYSPLALHPHLPVYNTAEDCFVKKRVCAAGIEAIFGLLDCTCVSGIQ